jgi:hypothetical protein
VNAGNVVVVRCLRCGECGGSSVMASERRSQSPNRVAGSAATEKEAVSLVGETMSTLGFYRDDGPPRRRNFARQVRKPGMSCGCFDWTAVSVSDVGILLALVSSSDISITLVR